MSTEGPLVRQILTAAHMCLPMYNGSYGEDTSEAVDMGLS